MIALEEYARFRLLEQCNPDWRQFRTQTVPLQDGTLVTVFSTARGEGRTVCDMEAELTYAFIMSQFGVVKVLRVTECNLNISKSPLCYELDKELGLCNKERA